MHRSDYRQFFRIVYPWPERPRLVYRSQICEVLDCSERGIRFRVCVPPGPMVGSEIEARLCLHGGQAVRVRGQVMRVTGSEVALRLQEPGISFYLILKEQLYLRQRDREEAQV
jgi:hypothetical protein